MKIYFVRHGETDSNKARRLMGQRFDEPLNAEGIKQAHAIAEKLRAQKFDVIFSSPQKRAIQTAEAISEGRSISIILRNELKERDFGSLSGKTWEEMDSETGTKSMSTAEKDFNQEYDYRPFGGESAQDVRARFLKFISEVKQDYSDKRAIVIAHGGILRIAHLLFNQEKVQHIDNTAIVECEI